MTSLIPRHPSPAMVVAFTALLIALGGTSYAVTRLPANSVGAKQIKANAVASSEVKNASLLAKDFKSGQLPIGPRGPGGPQGPAGAPGPAGARGAAGATNVTVRLGPEESPRSTATCQPGERAVGGGGYSVDGFLYDSSPSVTDGTPTDWQAAAGTPDGGFGTVQAYVVCAGQ
jgi:hypothetical protein